MAALALFLSFVVAVVGCKTGGGKGIVTGKVTYKGAPLKGGRVAFATSNKQAVQADIKEDGTYTTPEMATGPAKISVQTSYMKQTMTRIRNQPPKDQALPEGYKMAGGDPDAAKRYVKIPDQYENPDTSGLTLDVKGGTQTFDIDIK